MDRWIGLVLMTPKTYVNHRQTEEQKSLIFAIPFILDKKSNGWGVWTQ